jgi:hypothetical protein
MLFHTSRISTTTILLLLTFSGSAFGQTDIPNVRDPETLERTFQEEVRPLLRRYCFECHNEENAESGIRVDHLNGLLTERTLKLWVGIEDQLTSSSMPPDGADQPNAAERKLIVEWISNGLHMARSRPVERNGMVRRLTVDQYRNSLRSLLGLEENVTDVLPPDAVSKDGFTNNAQSMTLSPLQIEAYINIARQALHLCIVDPNEKPEVQHFRMDLGHSINRDPFSENLILGANSHLLNNADFIVTEPVAVRDFPFEPIRIRTEYLFNEGYQGNSTVRGEREYTSIYHSVFACMRGNPGYPKGNAFDLVPAGLLLRPAIPSRELFQVESTYGPRANFKIAVRELPKSGNFRVRVRAAKYDDGLLLKPGDQSEDSVSSIIVPVQSEDAIVDVPKTGIYQVDVVQDASVNVEPNASHLTEDLVAHWDFNGNVIGRSGDETFEGSITEGAKLSESPFGSAVDVDGSSGTVVVPRDDRMNVGDGEFSVAAWIHPRQLKQGGIVCLGKYNWTHGWYFDMPNGNGVIRIETVAPNNQSNGTVQSPPGILKPNQWQHVAAVVRRDPNETELFVNGYKVAEGKIGEGNLDNPSVNLHIGRIQDSQLFNGMIDEVRIYRRALSLAEIQALVEPGRTFATRPTRKPQQLKLQIGDRHFAGMLNQPSFVVLRLPAGNLPIRLDYPGEGIDQIVLNQLADNDPVAVRFKEFDQQSVHLGVHVGLRRDCGHTMSQVGKSLTVVDSLPREFSFIGAINNYPSPDVQSDNDNYLAGVREIGVRSEYTDGRDRPRMLVNSVEFEGPFFESWPPKVHQRIFIDSPHRKNPKVYAREVIAAFATKAFRRPVRDEELKSFMVLWESSYDQQQDFYASIRDALTVVLASPQFLFITETSASPAAEPISDYELASKLSYFLWNEPPDQVLLNLAAAGQLRAQLQPQVDRLIDDARFQQFSEQFAYQWLSLDKFDVVEIDRTRFPKLTRETRETLRHEPAAFLNHLFIENLPVRNLIRSDFILSNEITAKYYGLPVQTRNGFDFGAVEHRSNHLGGLLTQAGILAGLSDGRESNPVKRGAWFARKIIAEPPDDPPPNVPELSEDTTQLSQRERLEKHRNQKGCVKCHAGIDPWGLPFEQFDASGLLKNKKVDSQATLPDNTQVDGMESLKQYLIDDQIDQVAFSVLKHLTAYACGRTLSYNEIELLKQDGLQLSQREYQMRDMLHFVVNSDAFLTK